MPRSKIASTFRNGQKTLRLLCILVLSVCLSVAHPANAQDEMEIITTQKNPVSVPNDVSSFGAFTYRIPLQIPYLHGVQPDLGLAYNSSNKSRASADSILGVGWSLAGLSKIERVSQGMGIPTFDDANDIFQLDGQVLLACQSMGGDYPTRFIADQPAASCLAGGDFVTIREDFRKITFNQSTNIWTVYQGDGTKFIYKSLGDFEGNATKSDPKFSGAFNLRRKTTWLLRQIKDVHDNSVWINYAFDPNDGNAYRPIEFSYAGYKVNFGYTKLTAPLSQWANGTEFYSQQFYRLDSITTKHSSSHINGYKLAYAESAQTKSSLLKTVTEYGRNLQLSDMKITGGTPLPNPYRMHYSNDGLSFTKRDFPGYAIGQKPLIWDIDSDGRDEILQSRAVTYTRADGCFEIVSELPALSLRFGDATPGYRSITGSNLQPFSLPKGIEQGLYPATGRHRVTGTQLDTTGQYILGLQKMIGSNPTSVTQSAIIVSEALDAGGGRKFGFQVVEAGSSTSVVQKRFEKNLNVLPSNDYAFETVANLDLDPDDEIIFGGRVFDQKPDGSLVDKGTFGLKPKYYKPVDLDGDTVTEFRYKNIIRDPGFTDQPTGYTNWTSGYRETVNVYSLIPEAGDHQVFETYADVTGDGIPDFVYFQEKKTRSSSNYQMQAWVAKGTGKAFLPAEKWLTPEEMPESRKFDEGEGRLHIADFNNDGLNDVMIRSHTAPQGKTSNKDDSDCWGRGTYYDARNAQIYLSTGSDFLPPISAAGRVPSNAVSSGDFNGDGKTDILLSSKNTGIAFGSAPVPHLLTSITGPMGGATKVKYWASTQVATDNKVPAVDQLTAEVRRENGRGQARITTYRYDGGRYDYRLRRPLGFKKVTMTLPKIELENSNPQIVKEYYNNSFAEHGTLKERKIIGDGKTWKSERYYYEFTQAGNGPFKVYQTRSFNRTLHGSKTLETSQAYEITDFGVRSRVTDFGATQNGAHITTLDDVTRIWTYVENLGAYIVDKPNREVVQRRTSSDIHNPTLLKYRILNYDDRAYTSAPTKGNLTSVRDWKHTSYNSARGADALGLRTVATYGYDYQGNLSWEKDAAGHMTSYGYAGPRRIFRTRTTNPLQHTGTSVFDNKCQKPTLLTDPNGLQTRVTYDNFCRHVQTDYPDGNYLKSRYDHFGDATKQATVKTTLSGGTGAYAQSVSKEFFDGFGQTYRSTQPGSQQGDQNDIVTLREFDLRGNLISESRPLTVTEAAGSIGDDKKTSHIYDTLGRTRFIKHPNGVDTRFVYSSNGRLVWFPDGGGQTVRLDVADRHTYDQRCHDGLDDTVCGRTGDSYDSSGRKIFTYALDEQGTDAGVGRGWRVTHYRYDQKGQLLQVIDPEGATFRYDYDAFGNKTVSDDPSLGRWTMTYDTLNRLTEQRDAKNQKIRFTYDALGRVKTKKTYQANGAQEEAISYAYDTPRESYKNKGKLVQAENARHRVTYDYGVNGQVAKEVHWIDGRRHELRTDYRYDKPIGLRLPYNGGSDAIRLEASMEYDAAGRLRAMPGKIRSITYNAWGKPTDHHYQSNVRDRYVYDTSMGWLTSVLTDNATNLGTPAPVETSYTRTPDGRIKSVHTTDAAGRYTYGYDYAGRLITADAVVNANDQTFTYDRAGKMRSNSELGTYDYRTSGPRHAPYRIRKGATTTNLSYDDNGNMLAGIDDKTMTYDVENRPLTVKKAGVETEYEYGADGERLKKTEIIGGTTETTVYFGPVEIRKYGHRTQEKVITYPHPNVRMVNGTANFLHVDQLGSVRNITKLNKERIKTSIYKPYGEATHRIYLPSETTETKGFIGERFDAGAGLQYLNARYYDPRLALFIQPDWYDVTNPRVGTNRYAYSLNDPVNLADPNGNFVPLVVWGAVAAYKAVSVAVTAVDTIDTFQSVANGEMTLGQAAASVTTDVLISATLGSAAKIAGRVARRGGRQAPSDTSKSGDCSCGCSSFHPDTLVVGQDGMVAIDQIRVGDYVLAASEGTGALSYQRVTATHQSDYAATYVVSVASDDGGEDLLIRASLNHPFFVVYAPGEPRLMTVSAEGLDYQGEIEGGAWVDTRFLRPGMHLREADGTLQRITGVEIIEGPLTAHNLTVEEDHTYFVGTSDDAVWVHNCDKPGDSNASANTTAENDYARPSGFRNGVREKVWEDAREPSTGQVRDPTTGKFMSPNKPWDMGHKPGFEFRKHQESARARGISREQFLDEHNNPDKYRPERPDSNRSHKGEDKTDTYFGD